MTGSLPSLTIQHKIKGGKWTVARFFSISVAFSLGWMTVASQLGHYKILYGPAILLQMNIAYSIPSIPLLIVSSYLDDWLDNKFGIAKTMLGRLLLGLGGCATVTAIWPFLHPSRRVLLALVVILGLVSGVAFSTAYQLVARFANKNTISLGLGCVGSGLVALIITAALAIKATPSHFQEVLLFELVTGVIVLGGLSAFSLLVRHWNAIEASQDSMDTKDESSHRPLLTLAAEVQERLTPVSGNGDSPSRRISKSLSRMIQFTPLDPLDTLSDPEKVDDSEDALLAIRDLFKRQDTFNKRNFDWSVHDVSTHTHDSLQVDGSDTEALLETPGSSPSPGFEHPVALGLVQIIRLTWPVMMALFLAGTVLCVVFPFFTYVPSSGQIGDTLPQVLFYVRLFGDIAGRLLPRIKRLAMRSQRWLFTIACILTATVPFFFWYIKSSFQNDYLSIGYVLVLWLFLGYVNTCSYMLAPQKVPLHAKSTANGALAIMYQASHMLGLAVALALALGLYGSFDV